MQNLLVINAAHSEFFSLNTEVSDYRKDSARRVSLEGYTWAYQRAVAFEDGLFAYPPGRCDLLLYPPIARAVVTAFTIVPAPQFAVSLPICGYENIPLVESEES